MNGKTLPTLMFGLACAGILAFFMLGQKTTWVGHTNATVNFVVTDAESGEVIPDAALKVWSGVSRFCEDRDQPEFTVKTDQKGMAAPINIRCMCYGSESVFENTYALQLPEWCFVAKAPGYVSSDLQFLGTEEHRKSVRRGKPNATVTVPVRLSKHRSVDGE